MRDATKPLVSKHFSGSNGNTQINKPSGKVLVPNSSPLSPSTRPPGEYIPKMGHYGDPPMPSVANPSSVFRGKLMQQEMRTLGRKPAVPTLSTTASSSRSSSVRQRNDEETSDSEARPRKKPNNTSSSSLIDFDPLSSPIRGTSLGAAKSDVNVIQIDSSPLQPDGEYSLAKPRGRLVRGRRISTDEEESTSSPLTSPKIVNQLPTKPEPKATPFSRTNPITVVRVTQVPVRVDKGKETSIFARPAIQGTPIPKLQAKPTPKPQPQPKVHMIDSDSSSELSLSDDDEDEDDLQRIELALVYFNEASAEKLIEINGASFLFLFYFVLTLPAACTPAQAQAIITARPFENEEQLRTKLNRKKGVSPRVFDDYVAMLRGYDSVDVVVEKCELVAKQISDILSVWASASSATPSIPSGSGVANSAPGTNLVAIRPECLELSSNEVSDEQKRIRDDALEDYMAVQPESLGDVKLKDYQVLGINWLNLLHRKKLSCILADEMGKWRDVEVPETLVLYLCVLQRSRQNC